MTNFGTHGSTVLGSATLGTVPLTAPSPGPTRPIPGGPEVGPARHRPDGTAAVLHPVGAVLHAFVRGDFPVEDGGVRFVKPWHPQVEAVVSFTAHAVVATSLPRAELDAAGIDAYEGTFAPAVMTALAGPDGAIDSLDVVLLTTGTGHTLLPERAALADHPRVVRARRWRQDVHVHGDERGLVTVSRGLGGLAELSFEVAPDRRGPGLGRSLLAEARGLVAEGEPVVALVAPGNARSLRSALAAGFVPVGAAQLVRPGASRGRAGARRS